MSVRLSFTVNANSLQKVMSFKINSYYEKTTNLDMQEGSFHLKLFHSTFCLHRDDD